MFIEAVPVGVEPRQLSSIIVLHVPAPIHGSVLLVTENNAITGLTISCAFTALAADGLFFVAFELSLATSKTVNQTDEISRIPWRDWTLWQTHHPVRDLIASLSSSWVLNWHHLKVANDHVVELQVKFNIEKGVKRGQPFKVSRSGAGKRATFPGANLSED
jgi:hypothetical protein